MGEQLQWPLSQTAYQLLSYHGGNDKSTREGGCIWSGVRPSGIKLTVLCTYIRISLLMYIRRLMFHQVTVKKPFGYSGQLFYLRKGKTICLPTLDKGWCNVSRCISEHVKPPVHEIYSALQSEFTGYAHHLTSFGWYNCL